jgi:methionyl-tRNA formyltransferase
VAAGSNAAGGPLRVVFVGNAPWSVPSMEALAGSDHHVARVLTRTPRPAGRGGDPAPTAVATSARGLGLPLLEVPTVRDGEGLDGITSAKPDVLVVVAYGEILPPAVLSAPRLMPVNVHFSLLPALRGAAPVQRAILGGLSQTGVTTMRMGEGMDTGPILLRRSTDIGEDEDAGALGDRLAAMGGSLLIETLDQLAAGRLEERPQDASAATVAPKLTPEDERIDWHRPAAEVARRVRGLSPAPGAATALAGVRIKIYRASPAGPAWAGAAPGELRLDRIGPLVATGDGGALRLEEVQTQGRRRMTGADWARGARLEEGALLG